MKISDTLLQTALKEAYNKQTVPDFKGNKKSYNYTVFEVKLDNSLANKEHLNDWNEVQEWAAKYENRYAKIKIVRSDGKEKIMQHNGIKFVEIK